jgi:hypothetical protein
MAAVTAAIALYRALVRKGLMPREEARQILLDAAISRSIEAEALRQETGVSKTTMEINDQSVEILKFIGSGKLRGVHNGVQVWSFIFFDDDARFEQSADQLIEALNTDITWIRQHTEARGPLIYCSPLSRPLKGYSPCHGHGPCSA